MSILNKIKKNNTLIKHSGAIHITNKLTLIDRKVINVLLKNAYDDLGKKDYYEISIPELGKAIGWDGKNYQKIKNCLTGLNYITGSVRTSRLIKPYCIRIYNLFFLLKILNCVKNKLILN